MYKSHDSWGSWRRMRLMPYLCRSKSNTRFNSRGHGHIDTTRAHALDAFRIRDATFVGCLRRNLSLPTSSGRLCQGWHGGKVDTRRRWNLRHSSNWNFLIQGQHAYKQCNEHNGKYQNVHDFTAAEMNTRQKRSIILPINPSRKKKTRHVRKN